MPINGYVGPRTAPGAVANVCGVASSVHAEPSFPERYRPLRAEFPVKVNPAGRFGVSGKVSPSARPASDTKAHRTPSVPGAVPYAKLIRPIGSFDEKMFFIDDVDDMNENEPALPPDVERY